MTHDRTHRPDAQPVYLWPRHTAVSIVGAVLGAIFATAGVLQVLGVEMMASRWDSWGYAPWTMSLVGSAEILLGLALFVPVLRFVASAGLLILMGGALATHLLAGQAAMALVPAAMIVGLLYLLSMSRSPAARRVVHLPSLDETTEHRTAA